MSSITVNYEYKEIGTLHLVSGFNSDNGMPGFDHFFSDNKDDPKKSYWLRVNFEHISTGATYCANFDDGQIRGFCAILKFDPELLNDFIANKPDVKIQQENIIVGFNLQVVSKVYSFNIQIPKYIPTGSPTEVVELRQQNNILTLRIKTLEDKCIRNELMFAKFYMIIQQYLDGHIKKYDEHSMTHCIELCGENPDIFVHMIANITEMPHPNMPNNKGDVIIELLKKEKMPQFKQYIIDNKKQNEIYRILIGTHICFGYIDILLHFCQLGLKINCIYSGEQYSSNGDGKKYTYRTLLQHFDYAVSKQCIASNVLDRYNYHDFCEKCKLVRKLLIEIET